MAAPQWPPSANSGRLNAVGECLIGCRSCWGIWGFRASAPSRPGREKQAWALKSDDEPGAADSLTPCSRTAGAPDHRPVKLQTDEYLPSLNGMRALSVALVIGGHFFGSGHPELNRLHGVAAVFDGSLGVRIFFVISGFLITYLLLAEENKFGGVSLKLFYMRRFLRLFPVQFCFLGFLLALTFLTQARIGPCNYLTALTYTKNYACSNWLDGHLWSLSIEEQFYLIWPVVFVLLPRNRLSLFAAMLICVAPLSRAVGYFSENRLYLYEWFSSNCDALMIGCVSAFWARNHLYVVRQVVVWRPTFMRLAAVALMYAPVAFSSRHSLRGVAVTLGPSLEALCAAYLILSLAYHKRGWGFDTLNNPTIVFIGAMSYSLYIWQEPFLSRPEVFGSSNTWFLSFPTDLMLIFAIAFLSYWFLEKPLARVRRNFRARLPSRVRDTVLSTSNGMGVEPSPHPPQRAASTPRSRVAVRHDDGEERGLI